jgi:hypothetical protein
MTIFLMTTQVFLPSALPCSMILKAGDVSPALRFLSRSHSIIRVLYILLLAMKSWSPCKRTFHVMLGQLSFTHGLDRYPNIPQLTLGESSFQHSDHFTKIPASARKGRGRRGAEGVEPSASLGKEELGLYEDQRRSRAEPGRSVGTKPPISRSLQYDRNSSAALP